MSYIKSYSESEAPDTLRPLNEAMKNMFGIIPDVFASMNLRPDLLEPIMTFAKRLMNEDHGLSRFCKELLAAYVSKLNSCAY